eukprot:m.202174 g.202174  ORF g.202174 m.202174 type:complete len:396 (+) comp18819_c0_seq1:448-1635(+)
MFRTTWDTVYDTFITVNGKDLNVYINTKANGLQRWYINMTDEQARDFQIGDNISFFHISPTESAYFKASVRYIQIWNRSMTVCEVGTQVEGCATTRAPTIPTTPAPSLALTCPSSCGSATLGGGTCTRGTAEGSQPVCTSCNADRYLFSGHCVQALNCRGNRVRSGPYVDMRCRCIDANCFYCRRSGATETCSKCRNGYYLYNSSCVATCPASMAYVGISAFNRYCAPAPFHCVSNRVTIDGRSQVCKCPEQDVLDSPLGNCHNCTFLPRRFGGQCNTCRNSKFLYNGSCLDDCSTVPVPVVAYDIGSYGRVCRSPFTCAEQRDRSNPSIRCKCPQSIGGSNCRQCDWGIGSVSCIQCQNNRFLHLGICVLRCPIPYSPSIPLVEPSLGRTCHML